MTTWWQRLLNRLKIRKDILLCVRQEDTWCWPDHLGARTSGECFQCGAAIFFEKQNELFRKVCNQCVLYHEDHPNETS